MKKNLIGKLIAAAAISAAMTIPAQASSADSYILFLPTSEAISYDVDQSHVSSEYSTDDYTILLYKPGEVVSLGVDTDYRYYVEDAMETTTYASYEVADDNGVSFIMPEEDILFVVKDEAGNPLDAAELSAQSEAPTEAVEETAAETQAAQTGESASGTGFKMNEEQGRLSIQVKGGIKAEVVGTDGNYATVDKENGYLTGNSIDMVVVTADGGQWDNPEFKLYRNSEEVQDLSNIVINSGGWDGEFKIDLKNAWTPGDGAWTLTIKENGYVEEAPAETLPEETVAEETVQVEETEPEIGAGAMLSAFGGGETEAVQEEETEPAAAETNAFLTDVNPEDFPQFGETEAVQTEAPTEVQTEAQTEAAEQIVEETEVQTEAAEQIVEKTEVQTEAAEQIVEETEVQTEAQTEAATETKAQPTKTPEFYQGEIDMEIPFNYVPVPGRDDVFMVLNRDGEVEDFKILVRDGDEIKWEDLIPAVVDVPGLEDVYAVSDADGNVSYFKYARRTNSTYTFIETDENGNPL